VKWLFRGALAFGVLVAASRAAEPGAAAAGFDVLVFPTTQYAHTEIFYHTPAEFPPPLALASEIAPGQRLDLLVLARGFAVDHDSQAHVTYTLIIHRPDGTTRVAEAVPIAEKKRVEPSQWLFPATITSISANPGDPTGEYRFEITAQDQVGGGKATKFASVRVSDSAEPLPLPADTDTLRFLTDYYQHPRPRLALSALIAFSRSPYADRKADGHGTLLGFYEQVLNDNPWLVPQFTQRLSAAKDESERRMFALVLAYTKRNERQFGADLPRAARTALAEARKEALPLPSREPNLGGQLDLQWGIFLASGRFAPIAELVAVVENYLPFRGKLEEFKKLPAKPKTLPPDAMKDVLLSSALWSLGSNAAQQKLVRYYLVGIGRAGDTPPAVKAALQEALAWQPKDSTPAAAPK
jgi:hypothetical protein